MKDTKPIRIQHSNSCIQCSESGGEGGGPMYKWGPDGKCQYKSLRACQVANGPPVIASHEDFERTYRDLPTSVRDRWDLERFEQLSVEPVQASARGRVLALEALEQHKLPKPEEDEFGGIASATGVVIEGWTPTIIESGAFKATLSNPAERNRVKVLYQHSLPIGIPTFMEETKEGLVVMGKVSQTELGKEVLQLLRDGVIDEMSIGWDPVEFFFREEGNDLMRVITELRLWEFSAVTFGANPGAKISVVNALRGVSREADQLLDRVAHELGICCSGCRSGGECSSPPPPELASLDSQGAITLISTAIDRVRHGKVSSEEAKALVPLASMLGRVLGAPATPTAITQENASGAGELDVEAALGELEALESLVQ